MVGQQQVRLLRRYRTNIKMSDGFKGMMKNGWHPKGKDGGRESWRGDFKGINQVVNYPPLTPEFSADDGPRRVGSAKASSPTRKQRENIPLDRCRR